MKFSFHKSKKAFTLIEMLIVIVIIGILAAALIPRLTSVRARANDTARKADLQQIGSLIASYNLDKNIFPLTGNVGTGVNKIWSGLQGAGAQPKDPSSTRAFSGILGCSEAGQYCYVTTKKNGSAEAGFILMAYPETEGGSNRVYLGGELSGSTDTATITPCSTLTKTTTTSNTNGSCNYSGNEYLRYIYVY